MPGQRQHQLGGLFSASQQQFSATGAPRASPPPGQDMALQGGQGALLPCPTLRHVFKLQDPCVAQQSWCILNQSGRTPPKPLKTCQRYQLYYVLCLTAGGGGGGDDDLEATVAAAVRNAFEDLARQQQAEAQHLPQPPQQQQQLPQDLLDPLTQARLDIF